MPTLRYVPALDGLRCLAVVSVMLYHFSLFMTSSIAAERGMLDLLSIGWGGVEFFFCLSGFLITKILVEARRNERYFGPFFARRALRILPLYYGTLLALYLVAAFVPSGVSLNLRAVLWSKWYLLWGNLANVVTMQGLPLGAIKHFWSLAVEEQFYVVWPFVVFFVTAKRLSSVIGGLWIASMIARAVCVLRGMDPEAIYVFTPLRLDGLLVGSWLATSAPRTSVLCDRLLRNRGTAFASLSILTAGFVWGGPSHASVFVQLVGYAGLAIVGGYTIHLVLSGDAKRFTSWLASPALVAVGRRSYGLYVFHYPVWFLFNRWIGIEGLMPLTGNVEWLTRLIYFLFLFASSYALAFASFKLLEAPLLKLKRRFEYGFSPVPQPNSASEELRSRRSV